MGILIVIAVASLQRARVSANEVAAIGVMKAINTAQIGYASACGGGNFAPTLVVLGHKPPGWRQSFIDDNLAVAPTIQRSGYNVNIRDGAGASIGIRPFLRPGPVTTRVRTRQFLTPIY